MKDIKIIEANQPLTVELVQRWYLNIPLEISRGYLPAGDAAYFAEYYREALRRFEEALNRPEPNEYLRPRRDKTAAALKAIP